jgi:hypothetical protein
MSTDVDLEELLRDELQHRAGQTTISATALTEIRARAAARPERRSRLARRRARLRLRSTGSTPLPRLRPSPAPAWRRPVAALAAAVALLTGGVIAVQRGLDEGDTNDAKVRLSPVQALPDHPPAIEGTLLGGIARSCSDICDLSTATLDLATRRSVEMRGEYPLRDGRRMGPRTDGWFAYDPETGEGVKVTEWAPSAVDVLTDGRIAAYETAGDFGSPARLVVVDADGDSTTVDLPEGFFADGLTAGPDGWLAVVGGEACCDTVRTRPDRDLVLVGPDGTATVVDLDEVLADMPLPAARGTLQPAWSTRGLMAISNEMVAPPFGHEGTPVEPWTVVLDPTTGERVADIDGWHALAWSPDGTGLMAAQPTGRQTTRLRLFSGPALEHHTDLGELDVPFVPWWWVSTELPA